MYVPKYYLNKYLILYKRAQRTRFDNNNNKYFIRHNIQYNTSSFI